MSDTACTVSVIVAAYNAEPYIAACLNSIVGQSIGSWEAIVVDDHSSDRTADVVRSYAARDSRIRLLQTPRNSGPSTARNIGIAAARGTWVAILDADDAFKPERLERLIFHGEQAGSDVVADNQTYVSDDERNGATMFTDPAMMKAHRMSLEEFVLRNLGDRKNSRVASGFLKPIVRTAFWRDNCLSYDQAMRFTEDFVMYVSALQAGARWDYIPDPMYLYTIRSAGSLSSESNATNGLRLLFEFSRNLLSCPAAKADVGVKRAATLYYRKVRRWYHYRAIVNAVKSKQFTHAASLIYRSPDAIAGVTMEALTQAPILARRALGKLARVS